MMQNVIPKREHQTQTLMRVTSTVVFMLWLVGCEPSEPSVSSARIEQAVSTVKPGSEASTHLGSMRLDVAMWQQSQQGSAAFATASRHLSDTMMHYCQSEPASKARQAERLVPVQQAWKQAMNAWMILQGRDKGAEPALALSWHIQFWPDKKNTVGRQLTQWLKQDKAWQVDDLEDASVAVQGLGALEWFLYAHQDTLMTPQGCQLASAIGEHLAQTGQALNQAWASNPWVSVPDPIVLGEYVGALNNQLDRTIKKLTAPLGKPGNPKPYQAEAWRSGTSLVYLKASVTAMQQWYLMENVGLDALLREQGESALADRIANQFANLLSRWPTEPSIGALLSTPEGYRTLLTLFNGLEYIQFALHDDVAPALGIVMGFNATDGD